MPETMRSFGPRQIQHPNL